MGQAVQQYVVLFVELENVALVWYTTAFLCIINPAPPMPNSCALNIQILIFIFVLW